MQTISLYQTRKRPSPAAETATSPKEVVQLLSIAFAGVYEHESLSLHSELRLLLREKPSPVATASDPPATDFDVLRGEEEKVVSQ